MTPLLAKSLHLSLQAQSPHKFAWYFGDPTEYPARLMNNAIQSASAHGMFVEINLSYSTLLFSDGVNLRWHPAAGPSPQKHRIIPR
jgi:formamidopyrimidine-DNA glycosylase